MFAEPVLNDIEHSREHLILVAVTVNVIERHFFIFASIKSHGLECSVEEYILSAFMLDWRYKYTNYSSIKHITDGENSRTGTTSLFFPLPITSFIKKFKQLHSTAPILGYLFKALTVFPATPLNEWVKLS
ncbi:hypothetical protein D3C75_1046570 [compost metagenome]